MQNHEHEDDDERFRLAALMIASGKLSEIWLLSRRLCSYPITSHKMASIAARPYRGCFQNVGELCLCHDGVVGNYAGTANGRTL